MLKKTIAEFDVYQYVEKIVCTDASIYKVKKTLKQIS